jgi:N-acetyl-gamma-glutamyl-phosphate reductase common form
MGGEVLRVLIEHPDVELAWATSRSAAPIEHFHPNLAGLGIQTISPEHASACDVVFLAVPTQASLDAAARFVELGCRVVDLGAAFRLADRAAWEKQYGLPHTQWALAEQAVYGIAELHAERIRSAQVIANPGCFASAAILALAPLLAESRIEAERIVVDGLSGTAGVGAELHRAAHHAEIGENLVAYNVVGHRHTLEMEQELSAIAGRRVCVHFTPVYVPIVRGILTICRVFPTRPIRREDALQAVRDFYRESPFVDVVEAAHETDTAWQYRPYPWVRAVAGTNRCQIGVDVDEQRGSLVVLAALDSIGKGGAHAGVENMNLMFGLERTRGLERLGCHP